MCICIKSPFVLQLSFYLLVLIHVHYETLVNSRGTYICPETFFKMKLDSQQDNEQSLHQVLPTCKSASQLCLYVFFLSFFEQHTSPGLGTRSIHPGNNNFAVTGSHFILGRLLFNPWGDTANPRLQN